MEILLRPIREQEREGPEGTGHLMPAWQVYAFITLPQSQIWLDFSAFCAVGANANDLQSSVLILLSDFYCRGHSKDMQLLNDVKLINTLGLFYYQSFFFFLFPGVCLHCKSPSHRMSWFIFSLPFAMRMTGSLNLCSRLLCGGFLSQLSWEFLPVDCGVE